MAMQTDVKSAYRVNDGALYTQRTRLKGVFYTVTVAGDAAILYDNASAASGTVLMTLPAATVGTFNIVIPGEGILAENGIYLDLNSGNSVVAFYG